MDLEKLYVESLDEKSRIAYNIAKSHLGTLFSLVKSNHYIEWREGRGECLPSCSPAPLLNGVNLLNPQVCPRLS